MAGGGRRRILGVGVSMYETITHHILTSHIITSHIFNFLLQIKVCELFNCYYFMLVEGMFFKVSL